jgi:alkyl sulfatase BDS1-like metallo-beta-lactamase superfamily hydrolase
MGSVVMKQWILRGALVALGVVVGAAFAPKQWQPSIQRQVSGVASEASTRAALWLASQSDRVDARASLFVEFPEILPAIERGGAFGGTFSRAIATDIFNASEEGIADARKLSRIEAAAPRTWIIYLPLVNVVVFETDDGLVLVDAGMAAAGPAIRELIGSVTDSPIHTIIYTHCHVDHAYGTWALMADNPVIVSQADLPACFDRYIELPGSLAKYMGQPVESLPASRDDLVYPTQIFRGEMTLTVGGEDFILRARPGETDDQLYVWVPSRRALATADYYQGFLPNTGNGKRVQRYPEEWAGALREMASENAELLLPAHGEALTDPELIQENLTVLAEALEWVIAHTKTELNKGIRQDLVYRSLNVPDYLLTHPTLKQQYVSWEDISKMVMRRYVGWWDDIPSHWTSASFDEQAAAITELAGGVEALDARARELIETDIVMASHMADWAWFGNPGDPVAQRLLIDVYAHRIVNTESNTQEILAWLEAMTQARRLQLVAEVPPVVTSE